MTGQAREGPTITEIAPKAVRGRRRERRFLWYLNWGGFGFILVGPSAFHLLGVPGSEDLLRLYAALVLPGLVLGGSNLLYFRRTILAVNRVAVCEDGIYPPFKPKRRLTKEDWFVPYKDIVSMEPVAGKKGLVPAYNITLRDGLTFRLNALGLVLYVGEGEVRRYEKMLRVIREELSKPENRARGSRNEDVIIPGERFGAVAAG